MGKILLTLGLLVSAMAQGATRGGELSGTIRGYDKEFVSVSGETGSYKVPVEYFSDIKKMEIGTPVKLVLTPEELEKVKWVRPEALTFSKKKSASQSEDHPKK